MIKIKNLSKSFEDKQILNNVNLEIFDNETMVILGPSGQGKTVLIKTLNRLLEPDAGSIEYNGVDIVTLHKKQLTELRKRIAFVFQNSALFDFLTVKDNLGLFLNMHKNMKARQIDEKIEQALAFVGLNGDTFNKFPEELSGGMKKRVAIARAIIKEPEFIFYDEPTTGLDKTNAEMVSKLINTLKEKINATSIVVTHDIKLMQEISDRVALLKAGEFVFVGKKEQVSDHVLENLYNGEINEL